MAKRTSDPRAQRAHRSLVDAVIALLHDVRIDEITVPLVVQAAEVNRSTFYAHYRELDELLADALETIALNTGEVGGHAHGGSLGMSGPGIPDAVLVYLRHIDEYASSYQWALGKNGSANIQHRLTERFRISLEQGFSRHGGSVVAPDATLPAGYLAGAMIGAIRQWLETDPRVSPDVLGEWLWNVVLESFMRFSGEFSHATSAR